MPRATLVYQPVVAQRNHRTQQAWCTTASIEKMAVRRLASATTPGRLPPMRVISRAARAVFACSGLTNVPLEPVHRLRRERAARRSGSTARPFCTDVDRSGTRTCTRHPRARARLRASAARARTARPSGSNERSSERRLR